jgi:hypothetical protein
MLSLIQVEDNMTYIVCTPGASCQAMLLFSRENRQVFWSTSSIGDPFSTEMAPVPFHRLHIKNCLVLNTSVIDLPHTLSIKVDIKGTDSLTVDVASRLAACEPICACLPLHKLYEPQDVFADPPSSCPEVPIGILMELSPALRNCINDGDGNSNAKREDPFDGSASSVSKEQLCIPLGAHDTRNSMPFAPLWIIFSVMCAPSRHKTLLCVTSQDHGEIFTDRNQKFVDRISVLDIAAKNQRNDGYSIDPLVLEPQHGSACISAKVDIQVLMCLLARLSIGLSVCNGSLIVACDDHPLLSMHHLGHQSFPSVKYKQIQHNGTTSSFEPSTDYDTVNVIDLEWICQDPFGIKIKQVQCDGVAFSLFNVDIACAHHETSQMLTRTSFPITLIADASKGGLKSKEGIAQSILYGAQAPIGTGIVGKVHPASSASAALGSSVFSSMKGMLICGPKENGIFLQGTTTPLCAIALLCIDPSMATSAQSSCHLTLLKTIDTMANSFSYRDLLPFCIFRFLLTVDNSDMN